jgi:hypothetical protein
MTAPIEATGNMRRAGLGAAREGGGGGGPSRVASSWAPHPDTAWLTNEWPLTGVCMWGVCVEGASIEGF